MRNPTRTAGTAAALLVGVAVVSFFSVIAASLSATTADQIDKTFVGDVAVSSPGFGGAGFSPKLAASIGQLRSVAAAAPVRFASVEMDGVGQDVFFTDPQALATVVSVDLTAGSLRSLGAHQLAVSETKAKELRKGVGDTVTIAYPGRQPVPLTIAAVFKPSDLLDTAYVVPTAVDDAQSAHPLDAQILVKFRSGEPFAQARAEVAAAAAAYPNARVEDQHEIKQGYVDRINGFLALIFGMLALAIVIALMGISNTLQLSVFERTRELGLLRAVGATRQQLRAMVRWESIIIALFGTLGGLGLGVVFGWAIIHGLGRDQHILFRVPAARAVMIVVVGGLAGVLAALRPARRAGRLNVIAAIASE
jgi:putative ABC transport system permease protein